MIQDSAPRGTPSSSEEKKHQEPYHDKTGRKARAGSRKPAGYYAEATSPRKELLGVMKSPSSSQAARWAFDNLSLELQKTTEEDNFTEELEEFLKIVDNNDVNEEDFYKYFEFEHEDEDCAISTSARNYPSHGTRVTFDDDKSSDSPTTLPK